MTFEPVKPPKKAINKALLKKPVERTDLERFKAALHKMFDSLEAAGDESEEHCKNLFAEFLRDAFYRDRNAINTHDRVDLAIYSDAAGTGKPQVLFEVKRPANVQEMFTPESPNVKALHELILYHLRERHGAGNLELRHLAITNLRKLYLFDARAFEETFAKDKGLKKAWEDQERGTGLALGTGDFYTAIAKPFVESHDTRLDYVELDLHDLDAAARQPAFEMERLIPAYKLLSPTHLLKEPFQNDSNSLDSGFYSELLHIMGLFERKEGSKTLIGRAPEGSRNPGSLLELSLERITLRDLVDGLREPERYGSNREERSVSMALELTLLWINRLLFMKLLEAQMVEHHGGDPAWRFLKKEAVPDFDALENLFFGVLAKRPAERPERLKAPFSRVPYLNSSLFEISELERLLSVSGLDARVPLALAPRTILRDGAGARLAGRLPVLDYLFAFLDAYDFSADGEGEVVEHGRSLINASVLGLIFEKINGYKEGSFYTPGYITEYMARQSVEEATLRRFSEAHGHVYESLDDLSNDLGTSTPEILEANAIMDGLRIVDPAVGSGHFLVSALNALVAVKSYLGILADSSGKCLKNIHAVVQNDELFLVDDDGDIVSYRAPFGPGGRQTVREVIFEEKRRLIEKCLFGVDINRNSVQICKLRLWIELLKSAYYTAASGYTELETLPNIDINIKRGNSLVARYPLDMDLAAPLLKKGWKVEHWLNAVRAYQNAKSKEEKKAAEAIITQMRQALAGAAYDSMPDRLRLSKIKGELAHLEAPELIAREAPDAKALARVQKLKAEAASIEAGLADDEHNPVYRDAFEWRLEFPEVLDEKGCFVGFDVVIGNPPYIRQEELAEFKPYLKGRYKAFEATADIYTYFFERSIGIARAGGCFRFIVSNSFFRANYGKGLRHFLSSTGYLRSIVDFGGKAVFESAKDTYVCIPTFVKDAPTPVVRVTILDHFDEMNQELMKEVPSGFRTIPRARFGEETWTFDDERTAAVFAKCRAAGKCLGEYLSRRIYYGIKTGLNDAFIIDREQADAIIASDPDSAQYLHKVIGGQEIRTWAVNSKEKWIIAIPNGATWPNRSSTKPSEATALAEMQKKYPGLMNRLSVFREGLAKRDDQGEYWWELRPCDYYPVFESPKIVFPDICKNPRFHLDLEGHYLTNTAYALGSSELYLLGILNSRLFWFMIGKISIPFGERDGAYRFRLIYQYMEQVPIVERTIAEADPAKAGLPDSIESLVSRILEEKQTDPEADVSGFEEQIDEKVYALYGLSAEEIAIVEGKQDQ